jgi:hypothetical protein
MPDAIYLIQNDDQLVEMREESYDSEDILQELLAKYPNLLAGDQIDSKAPRRWLLITREMGLPDDEDAAPRWSIDHLFLDQEGIPTIVETKRSDDSRIRREVVGQMLDYAANAAAYWSIDTIIAQFEARCEREGSDPESILSEFLKNEMTSESFWDHTKTNLQAGKIRLVWVSDLIPKELRRIIEFLNAQMDPAQAIGVEVKMYTGQGLKTMVPRVINATSPQRGPADSGKQWTESDFFAALESRQGPDEVKVARSILEWAKKQSLRVWWGKGRIDGTFIPVMDHKGKQYFPLTVSTHGRLGIQFYIFKTRPVFSDESKRMEILNRLNKIPGISLLPDSTERYPSIPMKTLKEPEVLNQFLEVFEWVFDEIRRSG